MEATRNQYNRIATVYDRVWSRYLARSLGFLKNWAAIEPGKSILDVGCGTGMFEYLVLQMQPEQAITGVDISVGMLAIARQKCQGYANVAFEAAAATSLPFADRSFDRVISASTLHYFTDPLTALGEMRRVLKPDGELVLLDWCKDDWLCWVYDLVLRRLDPAHQRCYSQVEFHQLLTQAGYRVQRATRFRTGPAWGLMIASAQPSRP